MAMQWLRKNSKIIMVWIAVPIMVIFLLPFTGKGRNRGGKDEVFAQAIYPDGEKMTIRQSTLSMCHRQLQALEEFGVKRLSQLGFFSQIPDLGGVGPVPTMLTHFLVFGDPIFMSQMGVYSLRSMLYQMAGSWSQDDESYEKITAEIDAIFDTDQGDSRVLFLLLAQEAHQAGIFATEEQINVVMETRRQLGAQLGNPDLAGVLNRNGLTQTEFRAAIGDLISIMLYADMVTDGDVISENEIRKSVRDVLDTEQVDGSYVTFRDSYFREKIGEPTDEDLQKLFDQFKNVRPDQQVAEELIANNPYRFGYKLGDRIQLDVLSFDIVAAEAPAKAEFEKLSFVDQEDRLQSYWSEHKQDYPDRAAQTSENSEPKYQTYDQACDQVKGDYLRQQAVAKVTRILAEASQAIQNADVKPVDYQKIAEKYSTDEVKIQFQHTDFMNYEKASGFDQSSLGRARIIRSGRQGAGLMNMIFNCEPLRDRPAIRLDEPPVKLMEDITTAQTWGYNSKPEKAYIVRIVAVDREREPVSLTDDGRQGGAGVAPLDDGKNDLKEAITSDWKKMKAFEIACEQAEAFAKAAKDDWTGALKTFNDQLRKDPNDTWDRLRTEEIQSQKDMMDRYRDMMQQNPQSQSYYSQALNRIRKLMENCAKTYRDYEGKPEGELPLYKNFEETSCLVFKNLTVEPTNKDQYLNYKAATAHQLLNSAQGRLALVHFNPDNIKKRSGFKLAHPAREETEPEEEKTADNEPGSESPKDPS